MSTETDFRKPIVKAMRQMGAEVLCIVGSKMQGDGWPDIYVEHKHWSGWIEFKGAKTKIQPHQQQKMDDLIAAGATVFIARAPNNILSHKSEHIIKFKPPLLLPALILLENSVNVQDFTVDQNS